MLVYQRVTSQGPSIRLALRTHHLYPVLCKSSSKAIFLGHRKTYCKDKTLDPDHMTCMCLGLLTWWPFHRQQDYPHHFVSWSNKKLAISILENPRTFWKIMDMDGHKHHALQLNWSFAVVNTPNSAASSNHVGPFTSFQRGVYQQENIAGNVTNIWQCVKTLYPCSSHQNSWDSWMFIPLKIVFS